MPDRLLIVLGAGASADSASDLVPGRNNEWTPPLVRELFDNRFAGILNGYPFGQIAAADIRRVDGDSLSIEQFLRSEYGGSGSELKRRKFLSIPLYLQDVMLQVSYRHSPQPDNYDLLISNVDGLLEDTDLHVLFVTLNYDLILDRRLHQLAPLNTLDSYVDPNRRWALIKLHGSVDWARRVTRGAASREELLSPQADLVYSDDIVLARAGFSEVGDSSLPDLRYRDVPPHGYQVLYPALSVPLGEEDELSCPDTHVRFLRQELQLAEGLHLLVVGYSAIDLEVLKILQETDTPIRSFGIVNRDTQSAREVLARLHERLGGRDLGRGWLWSSSFRDFVQREGWDEYRHHLTAYQ